MSMYSHSGQVVTDLERAKRFYQEVFGFKLWYEFKSPEAMTAKISCLPSPLDTTTCYLCLDGLTMELIHYAAPGAMAAYHPRKMNEPGLTHLSFSVDDVRAAANKAVEYGGEIIEDSDIGIGLFIRDPEGQLVELLDTKLRANQPPRP